MSLRRTFLAGIGAAAVGSLLPTDRLVRLAEAFAPPLYPPIARVFRLVGHGDVVTSAAFSPDGKTVVTGSGDHDARLWSIASGRSVILRGHFEAVADASFSPDGSWIVTAGPGAAGLWRTSSAKLVQLLFGHRRPLTSAVFSPDGTRIYTASLDGTVRSSRCGLCGSIASLLEFALARLTRLARPLTPAERRRYLHVDWPVRGG